jgi:NAD(P)H-hydrate epimerase
VYNHGKGNYRRTTIRKRFRPVVRPTPNRRFRIPQADSRRMTDQPAPLPRLPARDVEGHKGNYGHAAIIGGSWGMSGAVSLSGLAALRSGAGLVTIATPDVCAATVAAYHPCYMTVPLPSLDGKVSDAAYQPVGALLARVTTAACGPGLGRSEPAGRVVARIYAESQLPLVIDADGLNALAAMEADLAQHRGPRILTPHPGEFARLTRTRFPSRQAACETASELARHYSLVMVLKGAGTWVTDGERHFQNPTGNPGMATAGSGDVLTGVVTALLGQGLAPFEAACLAVYVHGLAGDLAAEMVGQVGMLASDIINYLPQAFRQLE